MVLITTLEMLGDLELTAPTLAWFLPQQLCLHQVNGSVDMMLPGMQAGREVTIPAGADINAYLSAH